ncbi:putative MO25-like protein [Tanacetum coccineum]
MLSRSSSMKGLFKSRPRTPVELVHFLRNLLPYTEPNPNPAVRKAKLKEKIDEIRKVIFEMRTVLYGDERSEPVEDACAKLTQEFFKEDTFRMLIASLPSLDPGTRQDITHVIANLQRQRANGRCVASDYLECNTDILDKLLPGCDDLELALAYGAILRECIRHQVAAKYILESDHIKKFFMYVQDPSFDKASDAAATFRFFKEYNKLLESPNYITRRSAIKLLGSVLLDRANSSVMVRYVCSLDNMRVLMNLLRDSNKSIQVEAFHVFKLFVANQKKPPEIVSVLIANRSKLIRFFSDFSLEKADEQFEADKAEVVKVIAILELKGQPCSTLKQSEENSYQ